MLYNEIKGYVPFDEEERIIKKKMLHFIEESSDYLTRGNTNGHFTASAWIVNNEMNKTLMIYHNIYKSWAWVGGHADGNEDLLEVIKKEIEEETGIKRFVLLSSGIYGINIIDVNEHIKRGKIVKKHLHFDVEYLFLADECESIRIKDDENSDVKWININDVNNVVSEEKMKSVYKKLIKKMPIIKFPKKNNEII